MANEVAPATKMTQEEIFKKQEDLQNQGMMNSMRMQELQEKSHQNQQLMMGLSSIEKGNDDVMKAIANSLK